MAVQQFCLRWNNHQPNFISVFSSLLNSESLVDVTLAAEGRHLQAHKVVLSACSSYFQSLFMVNPCQHPIVILKDVKFMDLKIMVDFMYYGEVNVSQEQLPHILKTAEMLKIKGLAEMPDSTSLTKSQSSSTEKTELLTPGDSNWSSDAQRHSSSPSPCPLSPASRRKRLRKSSTGSGSASTEKNFEDQPNDPLMTSPISSATGGVVTKAEPNTSFSSDGGISHTTAKQHSSDSDIVRDSSRESIDENPPQTQVTLQIPQPEVSTVVHGMDNQMVEVGPSTSSTCTQQSVPGVHWTLVEHTYPRYSLSTCQTNLSTEGSTPTHTLQYLSNPGTLSSCAMAGEGYQCAPGPTAAPASPCPSVCPSPCTSPNAIPQTSIRRKRSINPQADENFVKALDAVRFGGIGFCKAARMFGVNNRTLWLEFKKRGYPNNRSSIKSRHKIDIESAAHKDSNGSSIIHNIEENIAAPHLSSSQSSNEHQTIMCTPTITNVIGNYMDPRHIDYSASLQRAPLLGPPSHPHINMHGIHYNSIS